MGCILFSTSLHNKKITKLNKYYWSYESAMSDNSCDKIRRLFLPPGIYVVVNPYQESHGVVATLGGAVQRPGNINAAHSGLHPFYNALKNEDIFSGDSGNTVYLAVFWFSPLHEYNAVLVGPFGNGPHQEEQMIIE